jgi:hypothetical protein
VFENRLVRRFFGPQREDVAGGWKRLHNEELHTSYASQNIMRVITSRKMRWACHVALTAEMRKVYEILVGQPEGNRPRRRPWRRSEHNIRLDRRGIRWEGTDWIYLVKRRDQWRALVKTVMNLRVP